MMTLYFQECNEDPPSLDPIQTAMLTLDNATFAAPADSTDSVDKYLPEPQSLKAVLKLDDYIRCAWLHAIRMEIKNLIDHDTFILGQTPSKTDLIIPLKLVLKAKQTAASGNLTNSKPASLHAVTWKRDESKSPKLPINNKFFNSAKKTLNTNRQTPFLLISHNHSKTHGPPVHLQEG